MIRGIVFPTQDVALVQGRGQLGFDMKVEEFPVHRPIEHPRRIQPVMAQGGDEGTASGHPSNRWRSDPRSNGRRGRDRPDALRMVPTRWSWPCWP